MWAIAIVFTISAYTIGNFSKEEDCQKAAEKLRQQGVKTVCIMTKPIPDV